MADTPTPPEVLEVAQKVEDKKEYDKETEGKFTEILRLEKKEEILEMYRLLARVFNEEKEEPVEEDKIEERAQAEFQPRWEKLQKGGDFRFFGIRKQTDTDTPGELIAGAMIRITEKDGRKHGWLGSLTVRKGYRGEKGAYAAKKLTEKRMGVAREEKCDVVETMTTRHRPVAIKSKLDVGFVIVGDNGDKRDVYDLKIDFENPITPKNPESPDEKPQEISFDQTKKIKKLLNSDWIGTKLERTGTESPKISTAISKEAVLRSGELENWTMTLEKRQVEDK